MGTTFKIYLPRAQEAAEPSGPGGAAVGVASGTEAILLVEDEAGVREFVGGVLRLQGYRVIEATCAEEALRLSQEWSDPIHLLLTDVVMPGTGGEEMAERLTHQRPGLRVLYMSGYSGEAMEHNGRLSPDVAFVQKPFTAFGLVHKVRQLLDGPHPAGREEWQFAAYGEHDAVRLMAEGARTQGDCDSPLFSQGGGDKHDC